MDVIQELLWSLNRKRKYQCNICGRCVQWPMGGHLVKAHGYIAATRHGEAEFNGKKYVWISGDYVEPFLWNQRAFG